MAVLFKHKITYFKQYNIYFYIYFAYMYIKNIQIILLKLTHQKGHKSLLFFFFFFFFCSDKTLENKK